MPVMADFARLPNQRKAMVFIVAGFLLFLLYYQFGFKSLSKDLDEAEGQHNAKVAANHKADQDIKTYNDLKPQFTRLQAQIAQNETALPTEAELPAFFETLNRKVTESGVQVNRSTQQPEAPIESFIRVPVDFEIQGTFMQIKRFFASLVQRNVAPGDNEERERRSGRRGTRAHRLDRQPDDRGSAGQEPRDRPDRAVHREHLPPGREARRRRAEAGGCCAGSCAGARSRFGREAAAARGDAAGCEGPREQRDGQG